MSVERLVHRLFLGYGISTMNDVQPIGDSDLPLCEPTASQVFNITVKTCELMTHPGYMCLPLDGGCGEGADEFSKSPDREHEIAVLSDPRLKQFFDDYRIITKHSYLTT